jgi:copper transport protein
VDRCRRRGLSAKALAVGTIGGLAARGDADALAHLVPRFSRLAFAAVVVIVVSGTFQSWRQLGTVDALTHTTYGRLLTVKLVLVAAMIGLGALSRSWVRRRSGYAAASSGNPGHPRVSGPGPLRRSVAGEVAVAGVLLAVTSLLVNAIPGEQALALPYSTELELGDDVLVDLAVDPAKAGPVEIHLVVVTASGQPAPVDEITLDLRLPGRDIGPLSVPLQPAGQNHFVAYDFDVPIAGRWELDLAARLGEFDQVRAQADLPIR